MAKYGERARKEKSDSFVHRARDEEETNSRKINLEEETGKNSARVNNYYRALGRGQEKRIAAQRHAAEEVRRSEGTW